MKNPTLNRQEQIVIHLHMPKTGGTTLKKIIKKNYEPSTSFDVYVDRQHLPNVLEDLSKNQIHCIQGHIPFGIHEYLNRTSTYITMLREPISRIISEYYFIRNIPWHTLHQQVIEMSLQEYQELPHNHNLQTHYILGNKFGEELTEDDLEQAKKILTEHFSVVGITEMFDQSLFLMKETFGWNHIYYKKANVTKRKLTKEQLSPTILQEIAKNNNIDMQLYTFAKALLQDKLSNLDLNTKFRIKQFCKKNKKKGVRKW
ncbi:sulfotransferase family 2 domain-containing protein [Halalkalibacter urbisdiaboli]|uniref:sulfotransferase family 2 domain-containing protein n=1 Tax=Halalkalibacter urbisdiaboli TaxID=1960589 RepID=UPI0013FDCBE6|nr:sulfotransferase family 2 domain-containing protein [Halalkalibacter urbisdiaboli]